VPVKIPLNIPELTHQGISTGTTTQDAGSGAGRLMEIEAPGANPARFLFPSAKSHDSQSPSFLEDCRNREVGSWLAGTYIPARTAFSAIRSRGSGLRVLCLRWSVRSALWL